ncbi:MAG: DNA primase [Myxococcota bacterium]|nr:DNA primase [Myxococcota bacterium]
MPRVPEESIQEIRSRVDIVGLIGRYVELKQAGRNWKGLCPFHNEKTPSFNVNSEKQSFHCFGCSEGGDVIGFLMKHENLSFLEALRSLAADCGVEIKEASDGDERTRGLNEKLLAANDIAQTLYRECLVADEGRIAREYLKGRGFGDQEIAEYEIGYAPDRWDGVARRLEKLGIPAEIGEKAGLLKKRENRPGHYDALRGRITFPIHDVRGRVVGFGGRALGEGQEPKYLNTPETPVFRKREIFYGFPHALSKVREAKRAIICEGYFDRIALSRAGVGEGLATCGTALTPEHAKQLQRRTREVVLLFDGDEAGRSAMERSLGILLQEGLRVRAVSLPGGEDPDTYLAQHGAEELRALVDRSSDAIEVLLRWAVDAGCATPAQKADVVNRVLPLVARVADPVERDGYVQELSNWTATDERAVREAVRTEVQGGSAPDVEPNVAPRPETREEHHLHSLAVLLFRHPYLGRKLDREKLEPMLPRGSWLAVIAALLDAADAGRLEALGAADLFALESRMDEDARTHLRAVALDADLFRGETPVEQAIREIVRKLEKQHVDTLQSELTRALGDPDADQDAIFKKKQSLREQGLQVVRDGGGHLSHV